MFDEDDEDDELLPFRKLIFYGLIIFMIGFGIYLLAKFVMWVASEIFKII